MRQINFVGNTVFGKRQLAAVIKTSATNMLSFLTGGDDYDPDRVAADREALRLYYRSKGYADASVTSAKAEYDPALHGFTLTFSIDEGPLYHFGDISVVCNVPGLDSEKLRRVLVARPGAVFDGRALDKTDRRARDRALEARLSLRAGHPAHHPRRRGDDASMSPSPSIRGRGPMSSASISTAIPAPRGYVIRREFDIAEGDAYNKTLIDRAERRLKNLNYFKTVKITRRPGSTPDRVVLDVEVVEQSTGDFNIAGGYSTTDGLLAEVKLGDRNFLGTGISANGSVTYGQYARGIDLSASEPYFLGTRVAAGIELYGRQNQASPYQSYGSDIYGATLQLGTPITEQIGVQYRYSLYNQNVTLRSDLDRPRRRRCRSSRPRWPARNGSPPSAAPSPTTRWTMPRSPTSGFNSQLRQDLAGLGGDVKFLRTTRGRALLSSRSTTT